MSIKTFPAQIVTIARGHATRRNLRSLLRFFLVLLILVALYTIVFHFLMLREGRPYSWITGLYWTLTVMSTLGFGDITFETDLGRAFSILVLLTGMVFLLILLPFTFIEFFYEPWMKAQRERRTPRRIAEETTGHVVLTSYDVVTTALIRRLAHHRTPHVLLVPNAEEAHRLEEHNVRVVVGALDDPETYRRLNFDRAAMMVTTGSDITNTNVTFTAREVSDAVPIVATAQHRDSIDIIQLAGATHVLRLEEMIGQSFARRTLGDDRAAHVIGHVHGVLVAEALARDTPLVGKTLAESRLRQDVGVTVAGVWERGVFRPARAETRIQENTVLVLVGSREQLDRFDAPAHTRTGSRAPILILGGGRVGRATARAIAKRGLDYRVVEKVPERAPEGASSRWVIGDAADIQILKRGGIDQTPTVIITTHDDDVNVYLTLYCRRLRPDVQIIARATHEKNVDTLHRAGSDFVLSYATTGASAILNLLRRGSVLMLAEGLDLFHASVSRELAGLTIAESSVRERTGCSVIGVQVDGEMRVGPPPDVELAEGADLLLIGTLEAEERFLSLFGKK